MENIFMWWFWADGDGEPDEAHWDPYKADIKDFFKHYNEEFFRSNEFVFVSLNLGSRGDEYKLLNVTNNNGLVTVEIKMQPQKQKDMIKDFHNSLKAWVLVLELDKTMFDTKKVEVRQIQDNASS